MFMTNDNLTRHVALEALAVRLETTLDAAEADPSAPDFVTQIDLLDQIFLQAVPYDHDLSIMAVSLQAQRQCRQTIDNIRLCIREQEHPKFSYNQTEGHQKC